MPIKLLEGDRLVLKKPHACGAKEWIVQRTGMDFRLRCVGCDHEVWLPRKKVEKALRAIYRDGKKVPIEEIRPNYE